VVEDFPGNYSDFRAYEDSTEVAQKENKAEKKDWKQNNPTGKLSTSKRISKNRKEIKDLEVQKIALEQLFTDEKYRIMTFQKKQKN
jgi:ATP-binding cassette subfamily F protein uup